MGITSHTTTNTKSPSVVGRKESNTTWARESTSILRFSSRTNVRKVNENQAIQHQFTSKRRTRIAVAHAQMEPHHDPKLNHSQNKGKEHSNPLENSSIFRTDSLHYIPVLPWRDVHSRPAISYALHPPFVPTPKRHHSTATIAAQ